MIYAFVKVHKKPLGLSCSAGSLMGLSWLLNLFFRADRRAQKQQVGLPAEQVQQSSGDGPGGQPAPGQTGF
jgi:hypothetical protein